jgi:glycerophosphoryl diester phosphodiesterase
MCRAAGVRVDFWTVNDPVEATALVALDVDGIMTDDPARVVPAVRATGR